MKFRVIKKDKTTKARLGILYLNSKKIKTPVLWLGCMIKNKPRPWEYFDVNAVMVNAYGIIEEEININRTIHDLLNINGMVMMDSGGFQLMKKNIHITPTKLLEIYKQAKPDIGVVLDFPFNPLDLESRIKRWKKTLENTKFMLSNSHDIVLMPVIHGYTLEEIRRACNELKDIADPKFVGVGSLVPILRCMKTSELSKLNGMNTIKFMIDAISIIRREFPDAFLHVFGVGSVTTMHLMFSLGVDSVDSMSWRIKAAYGAIQLPGTGDRFISPKNGRRQLEEDYLLEKCKCPICIDKSVSERKNALDNSNSNTFFNRAIHNAFVFKEEERIFHEVLIKNNTAEFIKERLKGTRYYKIFKDSITSSERS